jgi:hypothetical protein
MVPHAVCSRLKIIVLNPERGSLQAYKLAQGARCKAQGFNAKEIEFFI